MSADGDFTPLGRPQASVLGLDAYVTIHHKAAALLHSLTRNHGLVDGDNRLALAALLAFYGLNGLRLMFSIDEAFELVMAVACGDLEDVEQISACLRDVCVARRGTSG